MTTFTASISGAFEKAPTGARNVIVHEPHAPATVMGIAIIDESLAGSGYITFPGYIGRNAWTRDVARFYELKTLLVEAELWTRSRVGLMHVYANGYHERIIPDYTSYPPELLPEGAIEPVSLYREPLLEMFEDSMNALLEGWEDSIDIFHFLIDNSGSMNWYTLQPGLSLFRSAHPQPSYLLEYSDERWLGWINVFLEQFIPRGEP